MEGPTVSLRGSPTVSPTTAALCASEPLPPAQRPTLCVGHDYAELLKHNRSGWKRELLYAPSRFARGYTKPQILQVPSCLHRHDGERIPFLYLDVRLASRPICPRW